MSSPSTVAFQTLVKREVMRFMKVIIQTVVTPFMSAFLYLLVFGVGLGSKVPDQSGVKYLAFLIPGLVMMGIMNNAFQNSSSSVVIGKYSGELEDWKVLPISTMQIIWAMSVASVIRGFIVGGVTFFVGYLFYYYLYQEFLPIQHPFFLFYFIVVGGLVFGKLGIATAFWAKNFDQLSAVSAFVLLPLTYLGGVFLSLEHLSPFWRMVSQFNPLLYFINGMRYGVVGVSDVNVYFAVLITLITMVVLHVIARFCLKYGSFSRW